ncbi:hypothetical protein M9Y10_022876 [Tritrichomonas musculus]|uniref:UBX domain-containing protein n=1 Tax=Tritrichomonas musculus TaxID=1915356 RepID=A0ABR2KTJ7_9EUKA
MLEDRLVFRDIMLEHGISEAEMRAMTDREFEMTVNALYDESSPRITQNQPRNNRNYRGTTLDDGFGNGNIDEEEATRLAIEASLDDMLIAPHLRPKPSPQNEVGIHPRPSTRPNHYMESNHYYHNESTNYPSRPNPKPTPLPQPKPTRTTEYSKYNTKTRAPSCSHPRSTQRTPSQTKRISDVPEPSTKPQTRPKPAASRPSNQAHLVVTNSQPKVNSNSPIAGTTTKKTQKTTTGSRPPSSRTPGAQHPVPIARTGAAKATTTSTKATGATRATPTSGRTRTTTTTTGATRTNATRPSNAPAVRSGVKKNISSNPSNDSNNFPSRTSIGLAADEIIHTNKPSANQTPRSRNVNRQQSNPNIPKRTSSTNVAGKTTFADEAIFDPTPEILHPKHYIEDDDRLFDNVQNRISKPATNSKYSQPKPEPKPHPPPKTEEKPKADKYVERPLSESQIIRNVQDMEFIMAQQEAERKEREEAEKKALEEMQLKEEQQKKENEIEEARRLFKSIPPEPQNAAESITIAAQMPNNKRVMRKFPPNTKGIHIYAWISGQTLDLPEEERLLPDVFELLNLNQTIDKNKTLEEQNITKRVFLQIQIL